MGTAVKLGETWVGDGHPTYVIAEVGINHNGSLDLARLLIDGVARAGCSAVKFQKRTPDLCVPEDQKAIPRETPWGILTYMEYRERIEFGQSEYEAIEAHCAKADLPWFASCWDERSVDFIEQFEPPCYKIPSAALTDVQLLRHTRATGRPLILSTGMSTLHQIRAAVDVVGVDNLVLMHSTSTYPCPPAELNLRMIPALAREFDCPIGYSGHEVGLATTVAAVALGACVIERHVTLDRALWGSDQAASAEIGGMERLVRYIRVIEQALGDGQKRVYESEQPVLKRLRRVDTLPEAQG